MQSSIVIHRHNQSQTHRKAKSKKLECRLSSFLFDQMSQIPSLFSSGTSRIIFVPWAFKTQLRIALFSTGTVLTWRKEGKECTTTEFAKENLGRGRPSDDGKSVTGAPCVVTNSLQWGEKCTPVIEAPRSRIPGTSSFAMGLLGSIFQSRRIPLRSAEASILGCHGHQATAYIILSISIWFRIS